MRMRVVMAGVVALAVAGVAYAGGDPAAGKAKSTVCAACHGADGNSQSPDFPRLAGQYDDYLVQALHDYRAGRRKNPIMGPQAAKLSDQDIEDLAAYFSEQRGVYWKR